MSVKSTYLNLLKGRGMVWEKAKKNLPPPPHHHCYKPRRPPPRYIVARIGKRSTLTILRKSREL